MVKSQLTHSINWMNSCKCYVINIITCTIFVTTSYVTSIQLKECSLICCTKITSWEYLPPILALYATPTQQTELLASAATSPAQRVPWLNIDIHTENIDINTGTMTRQYPNVNAAYSSRFFSKYSVQHCKTVAANLIRLPNQCSDAVHIWIFPN